MHLAIAGNIGSGKTTLTRLLSNHYNLLAQYEDTEDNPYLDDFYHDMNRWSFNLQIYFLNSRFRQVQDIMLHNKNVVQDRTIYEDANIFAPNLYEMDLMSKRDFDNYQLLFKSMSHFVQPPDLLIYLRASIPTLLQQIQKRGRDYEHSIRQDYLEGLNKRYEDWIANYTQGQLLIIEVDNVNYEDTDLDFLNIVKQIDKALDSKFITRT